MESYKDFLLKKFAENKSLEKARNSKIAECLSVNTSFVSQVLGGDKHFSLEQIIKLTHFLSLSEIEEDYLINLVQYERSGTTSLRKYFETKIQKIEERRNRVVEIIPQLKILSEFDQSIFYSHWYFSAIRLSTDLRNINTREDIATFLNLPLSLVEKTVEFLIEKNLLKDENGKLSLGIKSTHLPEDSRFVYNHHTNWRLQAIENFTTFKISNDLAFTAPLTISRKAFQEVRKTLLSTIKVVSSIIRESGSDSSENMILGEAADAGEERLACFNIDFFTLEK